MLEKRSHASGLPFVYLMQADFVLFFFNSVASLQEPGRRRWWPETLLYYKEYAPPFEIFARSESLRYFQKVCPLIAVKGKDELGETFKLFGAQNSLYLPRWDYFHTLSLPGATNFEKLALSRIREAISPSVIRRATESGGIPSQFRLRSSQHPSVAQEGLAARSPTPARPARPALRDPAASRAGSSTHSRSSGPPLMTSMASLPCSYS